MSFIDNTGRKINTFKHHVANSTQELFDLATTIAGQNRDVYFAVASFHEPKIWNATAINTRTGQAGKWQTRTQSNVKYVRSLYLDLDVDSDPAPNKENVTFRSKKAAITAIKDLCTLVGLPRPILIDSGGGIHCYWPFETEVPIDEWRDISGLLKSICLHHSIPIDPVVPTDPARVLRVPGTFNFKKPTPRPVAVICRESRTQTAEEFHALLDAYCQTNAVSTSTPVVTRIDPAPAIAAAILGNGNIYNSNPLSAAKMEQECLAYAKQVQTGGKDATEPQWYNVLGVAAFCENMEAACESVSSAHPAYDKQATLAKARRWPAPVTCERMHQSDPESCNACPHWGHVRSPASLSRPEVRAEPVTADVAPIGVDVAHVPDPPAPYKRHNGTIVVCAENPAGAEVIEEVSPFDLYPVRILRQIGSANDVQEVCEWSIKLDRLGYITIEIPQSVISDIRKLHALFLTRGAYPNPAQIKSIQTYMSAYLRELARATDRDAVYNHLGWAPDRKAFVLGPQVLHPDGTTKPHKQPNTMKAITKNGMEVIGTLYDWKNAMQFYNGPRYVGHRFFLYASFAAPLFHMTGHKGVLLSASGDTGRGKTTCLEACASVWGHPEKLQLNGNRDGSTNNAMHEILGMYHSLPLLWDDTTERDSEEMRRFVLNISQGKGKERMKGHEHDGRVVEWETIVMSTANIDDLSRLALSGRDIQPHLARMINVDFSSIDLTTSGKVKADHFKRTIRQNYGQAGIEYMKYLLPNYDAISARVLANMEKVDRDVNATAHERYWTALIAVILTAAEITQHLGLLEFDVYRDYEWMKAHVGQLRGTTTDIALDPVEVLVGYLNRRKSNTLVVNTKVSNINNVIIEPRGALLVRHEFDNNTIYASRDSILLYCAELKVNPVSIEQELVNRGVITSRRVKRTLGADTPYASGQTICWQLAVDKLGADFAQATLAPIAMQQALPGADKLLRSSLH
jgi:hypothetical protein